MQVSACQARRRLRDSQGWFSIARKRVIIEHKLELYKIVCLITYKYAANTNVSTGRK